MKCLLVVSMVGVVSVFMASSCSRLQAVNPSGNDTIRFLTIGDFGTGGVVQKEVADAMEKVAETVRIDFVLGLGDNFYPSGVTSVNDPQWKTSFENVYAGEKMKNIPWYVALGNHDYMLNPAAQIEYSAISDRWNMPDYYYTVTFPLGQGKLRVVVMDTNPFEQAHYSDAAVARKFFRDTTTQKVWLDSVFTTNDATWTIVSGHHPFYTGGSRVNLPNTIRNSLLPIFIKHKLPVYFAGHEHDIQHLRRDDIGFHQFICGAGGQTRPTGSMEYTKFSASESGFMAVEITATQMKVVTLSSALDTLYTASIMK